MVWYVVNHRDTFIFTFNLTKLKFAILNYCVVQHWSRGSFVMK